MNSHSREKPSCHINRKSETVLHSQSTTKPKIKIQSNIKMKFQNCFISYLTNGEKNTTEEIIMCNLCQKQFKNRYTLSQHMRAHARNITCHICDKRYASKLTLFQHFKLQHWRCYMCDICKLQFPDRTAWISHLSYVHPDGQVYVCNTCDCQYYSFIAFIYHAQLHTTKCVCLMCNCNYPSKPDLQIHLLEHHSKVKEFLCNLCGKSWSEKEELIKHMERFHVPNICETVYSTCDDEGGGESDIVINNSDDFICEAMDEPVGNVAKTQQPTSHLGIVDNIQETVSVSNDDCYQSKNANQHDAQNQPTQHKVKNSKMQKRKSCKSAGLPDPKKARNTQRNSDKNCIKSPRHNLQEDSNTASLKKNCDNIHSDLIEAQKHFENYHSIPSFHFCKICNRVYHTIQTLTSHFQVHVQKIGEGEYICSEGTKRVDGNEIVFNDIEEWKFEGDTGSGNEDVHIKTEVICLTDENSSVNKRDLSTSVIKHTAEVLTSPSFECQGVSTSGVLQNGLSQPVREKFPSHHAVGRDDTKGLREKPSDCESVYSAVELGKHLFDQHMDCTSISCKICHNKFCTFNELMLHMNSHVVHAGNMKFSCSQRSLNGCNTMFTNDTELAKHFKTSHFQIQPPFCIICNKTFPSVQCLYDHTHYHTVCFGKQLACSLYQGKFPCKLCSIVHTSAHSLQEHVTMVHKDHGQVDIWCNDCNGVCTSTKTLVAVTNTQQRNTVFWCNMCNTACETDKMLQDHKYEFHKNLQGSGSQETVFWCNICNTACESDKMLQEHRYEFHKNLQGPGSQETVFRCSVCSTGCASAQDLKRHIETVHYNCNLTYTSLNSIQQHLKLVHADLIATFCKICRLPFPTIDHLKQHIACHITVEGENQFTCAGRTRDPKTTTVEKPKRCATRAKSSQDTCNRVYESFAQLEKHFNSIHFVANTLYCHICISCFVTRTELRDHIRSHMRCIGENGLVCSAYGSLEQSEAGFTCDVCSAFFAARRDLNLHIRHHFKKGYCNQVFSKLLWVQMHLRNSHLKAAGSFCDICKKGLNKPDSLLHMDSHILRLGGDQFACVLKSNNTHYVNESAESSSITSAEMEADGSLCSDVTYNVDDDVLIVESPRCESEGSRDSVLRSEVKIKPSVSRLSNKTEDPTFKTRDDEIVRVHASASRYGETKTGTTTFCNTDDEVILLEESEDSHDSLDLSNKSEKGNKKRFEMETSSLDTKKGTSFNTDDELALLESPECCEIDESILYSEDK